MNALFSFVAGEALAQSVGVSDTSDRQYCGLMMMIGGLTPLGALLTRQVALARVPAPVAQTAPATNPGGGSPSTGSGNCTDPGKAAGTPDSPGKTG